MRKIIAVNAGPRKGWNTDTLITEIKHHYCTALPIGTESAEVKDVGVIDSFHPTKAGYSKWWMPKLETELKTLLEQ